MTSSGLGLLAMSTQGRPSAAFSRASSSLLLLMLGLSASSTSKLQDPASLARASALLLHWVTCGMQEMTHSCM
jgi:hypothetical protein